MGFRDWLGDRIGMEHRPDLLTHDDWMAEWEDQGGDDWDDDDFEDWSEEAD